jgi:hypothetical protein
MLLGTIAISGLAWLITGGEDLLGKTYQADTLMVSGESFGSGNDKGKTLRLRTFGEDPRFQTVSFTTENGTTVLLTGLPSSSVDGIEAIGTQGTTEKYAALIRQLADQLEKSGEISSSEAAKIRLLADKGFIIGENLGVWERVLAKCQYQSNCLMQEYSKNPALAVAHGNLATGPSSLLQTAPDAPEIQNSQVIKGPAIALYNLYESTYVGGEQIAGPALLGFLEAFGNIDRNRLSNKTQELLNYLSREINKLSILGTDAYRSPIVSKEQTPVLMDNTFIAKAVERADWEMEKPSFLVDSYSTHICHVGQGEAKGQNCQ